VYCGLSFYFVDIKKAPVKVLYVLVVNDCVVIRPLCSLKITKESLIIIKFGYFLTIPNVLTVASFRLKHIINNISGFPFKTFLKIITQIV